MSLGLTAILGVFAEGGGKVLMLYEAAVMAILLIFDSNLLEQVLNGHEDDAVLVRLLQPHLSLLLVANHQPCFLCLNFL